VKLIVVLRNKAECHEGVVRFSQDWLVADVNSLGDGSLWLSGAVVLSCTDPVSCKAESQLCGENLFAGGDKICFMNRSRPLCTLQIRVDF
jgi:hypothetical protein